MSFELTTIEKPRYLRFRITGENSLATVRGYLAAIFSTCVERMYSTVLIEEHLSGPSLDIGEIFQIASVGSTATVPVLRVIAYVDTNPEHAPSKMQFAETVAVTRGINIRMFADVAAAETWLQDRLEELPD